MVFFSLLFPPFSFLFCWLVSLLPLFPSTPFPWSRKFPNCELLSSDFYYSPLFSPHPVALACSHSVQLHLFPDSSVQYKWLYTWKCHRKDTGCRFSTFPSATLSCVKLTQPTGERNGFGKSISPCSGLSTQRAGSAEIQRNPSVTWRPEYSSSGPEFGTTLCS